MAGPIDRNERARQQFQAQQRAAQLIRASLAAFAADFASGRAVAVDRFGSAIKVHDLILWRPPHDLVYEVTKIEPILDVIPNAPLGQIRVVVELMAPLDVLAGHPNMQIVVVGHQVDKDQAELHIPVGATSENTVEASSPAPQYDPQAEAAAMTADRLDGDAADADSRHGGTADQGGAAGSEHED